MEPVTQASDEDYVRVLYTHPNRGQHPVYGPVTRKYYGHRGGGQEFYVLRVDMVAMPQWFKEVREQKRSVVIEPEKIARQTPPPPEPVQKVQAPTAVTPTLVGSASASSTPTYDDFMDQMKEVGGVESEGVSDSVEVQPDRYNTPPPRRPMTVDRLPGVSPNIAKVLLDDGITDPKQVVELGQEGLKSYKGIGDARAEIIFEAASEYLSEIEGRG